MCCVLFITKLYGLLSPVFLRLVRIPMQTIIFQAFIMKSISEKVIS